MDPIACWERLKAALADRDYEEAAEAALDLRRWQNSGGDMPASLPHGLGGRLRDFAWVCRIIAKEV